MEYRYCPRCGAPLAVGPIGGKDRALVILYSNINGLKEGNPVTIAGYTIGKVSSIKLSGTRVAVEISIDRKVDLTDQAKAEIKSASIMGGKVIAVTPSDQGRTLKSGDTLSGTYEADLTELTSTLAPIVVKRLVPTLAQVAGSGIGVLLIEQFAHVALSLARAAYVLEGGRVRYSGSAAELTEHPELLHSAYLLRGAS